jgi:acetyl-CoA acetyltransferase
LACEAIKAACDDAGISPHEIDGLFRQDSENNHENLIVSGLGLPNIRHWESVTYGGGGANATVAHAAAAIAVGNCTVAVCWRAANDRSGAQRRGQARGIEGIPGGARSFAAPFGSMAAAHGFGMFARRYMHAYGATSRHFGWVAVTLRYHASRNPRALRREPITIEDHQSSRIIAEPLHLLDFCQVNDGAVALILTSAERARDLRRGSPLALIEAGAQASGPRSDGTQYRPDLSEAESYHTARDLYARSGLTAKEMDAFLFYDHFTPFGLLGLEAFGFVPRGQAKDFVEGGENIRFDGILPVNTHGGNHSEAYIQGMTHPQEAARLIWGESTSQPPNKQINRVLVGSSTAQLSGGLIVRSG